MWARSTLLVWLQSIGVDCNTPDVKVSPCQLYFASFRSHFSCELDQRPLCCNLLAKAVVRQDLVFSCQLCFAIFLPTLFMWAWKTCLVGQPLGINCSSPDARFFLVFALFYLVWITLSTEAQWTSFVWQSVGVSSSAQELEFFFCQLHFSLFSLTLFMWARSTPCVLQHIGVNCSAPDLDVFYCQLYCFLFSFNPLKRSRSSPT